MSMSRQKVYYGNRTHLHKQSVRSFFADSQANVCANMYSETLAVIYNFYKMDIYFANVTSVFSLRQVGLWIFGGALNVDAVTAAILGLSILLITGVVTWKECLAEAVAWDTLTWFAALIAMAGYLNKYGLISWFSQTVVKV